jgi:hypothetical protein
MTWKFIWRKIAIASFCSIACLWFGSTNSQVIQAKVGLNSFTPEQQQWFWSKVDTFALFDSFLRFCGHDTRFEQRIVAAAQDCATPEAIQTVRTVFRRKSTLYMRRNRPAYVLPPSLQESRKM